MLVAVSEHSNSLLVPVQVAEDPSIPRKIRNKVYASQEPAAEGHAKCAPNRCHVQHSQYSADVDSLPATQGLSLKGSSALYHRSCAAQQLARSWSTMCAGLAYHV